MQDLDFDELDKAVNSLMGGVKEKDSTSAASKTLDINTTLAPDEAPSYNNLSQVAEKIGSEAIDKQENTVSLSDAPSTPADQVLTIDPTPEQQPDKPAQKPDKPESKPAAPALTVPPRPAGRFMDVVHPSSDMRPGTRKSISREGVTIAAPTSVAPINTPQPVTPMPEPEQTADEQLPADTTGNLPSGSDTPDVSEDMDAASVAPEPLTSPFLPDAKVDKRPLGGASSPESAAPTVDMTLPDEKKVDALEQTLPSTESVKEGSSIMDTMAEPAKSLDDVTEHVPEEYRDELLAVEKNVATDVPPANPNDFGAASIPKQYQEKPSTGDETNGAIFDTTAYHKPLSHPPEKKSGWLWVVVIVIILLLGAGAGAAAYFFGLV
jgi:hypothetical protein